MKKIILTVGTLVLLAAPAQALTFTNEANEDAYVAILISPTTHPRVQTGGSVNFTDDDVEITQIEWRGTFKFSPIRSVQCDVSQKPLRVRDQKTFTLKFDPSKPEGQQYYCK